MSISDEIREALKRNLNCWSKDVSGGKELLTRCKYCSDSRNPNNGHFYIKIPQNDELILFNCFKCGSKGILTPKTALEWGISETQFITFLAEYNKRVGNLSKNRMMVHTDKFRLRYDFVTNDDITKIKLDYINRRLGTNLTVDDCVRMKIILNLKDLLRSNGIQQLTRNPNIVDQLDENFVGFLSFDNAFVNLRNIGLKQVYEGIDKRWVNYNIFNKFDNTQKFYTIPVNIDLLKPVELHIAEGAFDIISIKENLRKINQNAIFTSVGGNTYKGSIRHFLCQLGIPNLNIHIYPDNDISRDTILDVANSFRSFHLPIQIHRNIFQGEKDFGVPITNINEVTEVLTF